MGFLEEIERGRQQQIQKELARKAEAERQQLLRVQKEEEELVRRLREHKINASGFIADCQLLVPVLEQVIRLGFKDYLRGVSEISGFILNWTFYMRYSHPDINPEDYKLTGAQVKKVGSESSRQQLQLEERIAQLVDDVFPALEERRLAPQSTNSSFLGDTNCIINSSGLSEPQRVGIGIRFRKHIRQEGGVNPILKFFDKEHDYVIKNWDHAVYVRISSPSEAVITSSTQQCLELDDISRFDKGLTEAFKSPAVVYSSWNDHWKPSSAYGDTEGGATFSAPCLPGNSLISTPNGDSPIKKLKIGDFVWTIDRFGRKTKAKIIQKVKRAVSKNHKIAHLILKDGREIFVSAYHPIIEGKPIILLKKGQFFDGSRVSSLELIPYKGKYTYDILPTGDTGGYWVSKILMGSTLFDKFETLFSPRYSLLGMTDNLIVQQGL